MPMEPSSIRVRSRRRLPSRLEGILCAMTGPPSSEDDAVLVREIEDGIVLVEAAGEIDASTAPRLQRELLSTFAGRADRVLLDLSAVTYLDSSGVAAVIAGYAEAKERGARLAVVSGSGQVVKRMRTMGLDALLHPVASREAARERLSVA